MWNFVVRQYLHHDEDGASEDDGYRRTSICPVRQYLHHDDGGEDDSDMRVKEYLCGTL